MENQCADEQTNGRCDYQEYPGQDLGFGDLQLTATDKDEVSKLLWLLSWNFSNSFRIHIGHKPEIKLNFLNLFDFYNEDGYGNDNFFDNFLP